ncbi:hypothetical protein [uncultured Sulfitobacter sp.]|uniref:hypothetical protein n=1 Tax=uncultured Sulfitobacter sp. TaxID=191468 RepID=UPI002595DC22|nr:hypothetical protein [uncultured Sulfitobacter sp.]
MSTKLFIVISAVALGIGGIAYQQGVFTTQEDIFYQKCEKILKARLTSPSSYIRSKDPFVFITDENVATALMGYDASNALGVMIGGTALCTLELGQESKLPEGDYLFQDVRVDGTTEVGWHLEQANRILESLN